MTQKKSIQVFVIGVSMALAGCNTARAPYTPKQAALAKIPGFENVRAAVDEDLSAFMRMGFAQAPAKPMTLLSLSGGGGGGAFSVGALAGWTETGARPPFDVVTGVSTGAFIAPFAFLGPRYDGLLKRFYTSGEAENLFDMKDLPRGLLGESLLKPRPLRTMVERYVTPDLLREIAAEHTRGRRLFVLTTNLDTQRAILWNMGAIAEKDSPQALSLFRDVLIASASIPGAFPAVRIKAVANGGIVEELHSDGGSSSQFVTIPESFFTAQLPEDRRRPALTVYILINNALMPEFNLTKNSTIPVALRAYSILVKSQTKNGLFAIYEFSKQHGINFNVASIDQQVPYNATDPFNTGYMRAVYSIGYEGAIENTLWRSTPTFTNDADPAVGR